MPNFNVGPRQPAMGGGGGYGVRQPAQAAGSPWPWSPEVQAWLQRANVASQGNVQARTNFLVNARAENPQDLALRNAEHMGIAQESPWTSLLAPAYSGLKAINQAGFMPSSMAQGLGIAGATAPDWQEAASGMFAPFMGMGPSWEPAQAEDHPQWEWEGM